MISSTCTKSLVTIDNPFDALDFAKDNTLGDGKTRVIFRRLEQDFCGFIVSEGAYVHDSTPLWTIKRDSIGRIRVSKFRY